MNLGNAPLTRFLLVLGLAATTNMLSASTLASPDFPAVRWGFTTVNFLPHIPVTVESSKAHIDLAKELGFQWIELRDPDAALTPDQCREIAAHARQSGIEVNYSAQRGLLAEDFWEVFERAAANTGLFDGPRTIRVLALRGSGDEGWSEVEFARMVEVANEGGGQTYRGMTEFLLATEPGVLLQLDTANLFTGPVEVTPEEAEAFIRRFADRISYLHIKSARDRKALPVLDGNPLPFEQIFTLLESKGKRLYAAIELASGTAPVDEIYQNMKISISRLNK
jgi:sugar phosphate isomerase/epimerase